MTAGTTTSEELWIARNPRIPCGHGDHGNRALAYLGGLTPNAPRGIRHSRGSARALRSMTKVYAASWTIVSG